MRFSSKFLSAAFAAVFLAVQAGCGGGGSDGDAPPPPETPQDNNESRRQGESLDSLESRWRQAVRDKPTGVTTSVSITGPSLYLTATGGQAQVSAPGTLVPAPLLPKNPRCIYFADAQVGTEVGFLVLEGARIEISSGTLGTVDVASAKASTQAPSGSTSPVVELTTEDRMTGLDPSITLPSDWSDAQASLSYSDGVLIHASNVTLTGFTRGVFVTSTGSTPLTGSVSLASATKMYWDSDSRIQVASSTVHSPSFALGGEVQTGAFTSTDLQALSAQPSMITGRQGEMTLRPGSANSEGSFQLTQAVMQDESMLIQPELELAFDTKDVTVKQSQRTLIPVVYREKGLKGDAVLSALQVTGSGKEAVSVALDDAPTYLGQLWATVEDSGIIAPFLAIGLAPLSPFIAIGEAIVCLFSTCPEAYPVWVKAGTVSRFHVIVQGKVPPGTYEATVTLVGRNYVPQTIPVRFTVTE
ncbi:hypothetical protein [Hyalangium versicolor]|uniref:hypothetical protein n=1 Tax=Hyalangium versicolor TaxID=2861190 RepID=UPI001CCB8C66|nr:hypothetical protein [Hyalangium versicolor]